MEFERQIATGARPLILSGYETFERLIGKLPEPLREPLRREFRPLRDLFLRERRARLCVVVDDATPLRPLLSELFVAPMGESFDRAFRSGAWTLVGGRGREILLLVVRVGERRSAEKAHSSLAHVPPDAIVLAGCRHSNASSIAEVAAGLIHHFREPDVPVPVIAAWITEEGEPGDPASVATASISEVAGLARRFAGFHPVRLTFRLRQDGLLENPSGHSRRDPSVDLLLQTLATECPPEAHVSLARATLSLHLRQRIADTLTRAATTVSGIIGAQPIPLADLPLLTSLQIGLIAAIARVSGRPLDMRLATEFAAAAGYNIAAAGAFRALARLGAKLLPGWGNAVAGGIAAFGTSAVGKCASHFFIEEPFPTTRRPGSAARFSHGS